MTALGDALNCAARCEVFFNNDVRFSVLHVYTGSAADYDKPSLLHVGTGEGSQVYGRGLYESKVNIKVLDKTNDKGENQRLLHDVTDIKDITGEVRDLSGIMPKYPSNSSEYVRSIPYSAPESQAANGAAGVIIH